MPRSPVLHRRAARDVAAPGATIVVAVAVAVAPAAARADTAPTAPAAPPRVLVLPLPATAAVAPAVARAFDARLLVALDDTRRAVAVTPSEEPDCLTAPCLAALGGAAGAALVLSLSAVREADGVTLFGTLLDARTAAAVRRVEVARLPPADVARAAPAQLVPQLVAALAPAPAPAGRAGPAVLGVALPAAPNVDAHAHAHAHAAALAVADRLAAYRTFGVRVLDGADRAPLTHRADLAFAALSVVERRRHLCTWRDGELVATLSITELATGRVVFSRTVRRTESRRAVLAKRERVLDALVDGAVAEWAAAFHQARAAAHLGGAAR